MSACSCWNLIGKVKVGICQTLLCYTKCSSPPSLNHHHPTCTSSKLFTVLSYLLLISPITFLEYSLVSNKPNDKIMANLSSSRSIRLVPVLLYRHILVQPSDRNFLVSLLLSLLLPHQDETVSTGDKPRSKRTKCKTTYDFPLLSSTIETYGGRCR